MKRTLTGIFAATMVLGTIVPTAFAKAQASDVDSSNQYYAAISALESSNILNLYADGTFKPDQRLARAQFAAYVYNVVNAAGKITKHYTQPDQPYKDEDKYFRNQLNDMYLYGYLNNLDLGNGDFGLYWMTPAWWAAQLLCNVAGISYDSSSRYDAMNKARDQGWFANTPDEDANPNYYLNRDEMAQILENFVLDQFPDLLAGQAQSLTLSAKDATIAAGTTDALTLAGKDVSGADLTIDPSKVTYSVDNSSTGFVNGSGVFTATAPGKYTITANYGGVSASTTVNVYGQAAKLDVKPAGDLIADATSSAVNSSTSVAVNVYDTAGNLVQNYNGPVTLTSSNATDASVGSKTAATASQTVNAVNGVATFTVYSMNGAKAGDAPTLTATISGTSATGTGTVNVDAAQGTGFNVSYYGNAPQGLANNTDGYYTQVQANVVDQAGANFSGYTGYVTATISGPATFPGALTTEQVWVGNGVTSPLTIQGQQGKSGNVVLTFSATGLQTKTFTIPAYVQTGTSSLSVSADNSSVAEGGTANLTIKALDSNGNLALAENSAVTVSGLPSGVSVSGVTLNHGIATATLTNTSYVGNATLTFSYTANGVQYTTTAPFTFTQGGAVGLKAVNVANNVYAAAGTTQTVTFQLVDAAGNAVKAAGDTFTLASNLGNTALSSTTGTTDANGQFSVNLTLPQFPTSGTTATVTATESGTTTGIASLTQTFNVQYGWTMSQGVAANVYDTGATTQPVGLSGLNGKTVSAGDVVYLDVYGLNASNAAVAGDSYTITSSNPAVVGVAGLSDSSGDITGSTSTPDASGTGANVKLSAGLAGSAVITVTDNSVIGKPSVSFTVNVAGTGHLAKVSLSGLSTSASTPTVVTPGKQYAITVQLTDEGGNPAYSTDSTPVTVNLADSTLLTNFRNASGATITSVSIPKNVGSAVVYWVAPATATSPISLTASANGLTSGSITPLTLGSN